MTTLFPYLPYATKLTSYAFHECAAARDMSASYVYDDSARCAHRWARPALLRGSDRKSTSEQNQPARCRPFSPCLSVRWAGTRRQRNTGEVYQYAGQVYGGSVDGIV